MKLGTHIQAGALILIAAAQSALACVGPNCTPGRASTLFGQVV